MRGLKKSSRDDIGEPVSIDIAGRSERDAQVTFRIAHNRFRLLDPGNRRTALGTGDDDNRAGIDLVPVVPGGGCDHDVRVAVAIDVARPNEEPSEETFVRLESMTIGVADKPAAEPAKK